MEWNGGRRLLNCYMAETWGIRGLRVCKRGFFFLIFERH